MKENGIPKKTRFLWQVRISLIGFIPVAVLLFLCSVTLWCLLPAVILAAALLIFVLWYIPPILQAMKYCSLRAQLL